jgi:mono/diheme cytochrome c family protein
MKRLVVALLVAGVLAGCGPDPLKRMKQQASQRPYEENTFFEDGRAMRAPPEGTVPWRGARGAMTEPPPVTLALLRKGRDRFEIYCATCHGLLGDGHSIVARNLTVRPPPSLHARVDRTDAALFAVMTDGFGLMPSYADKLSSEERWAVVAYVRALQLSQRYQADRLTPEARARLEEATR